MAVNDKIYNKDGSWEWDVGSQNGSNDVNIMLEQFTVAPARLNADSTSPRTKGSQWIFFNHHTNLSKSFWLA